MQHSLSYEGVIGSNDKFYMPKIHDCLIDHLTLSKIYVSLRDLKVRNLSSRVDILGPNCYLHHQYRNSKNQEHFLAVSSHIINIICLNIAYLQ